MVSTRWLARALLLPHAGLETQPISESDEWAEHPTVLGAPNSGLELLGTWDTWVGHADHLPRE